MSKIIDRAGKGAALTGIDYDSNISTAVGKNQSITATTHTITVSDQSEVIEYSNTSAIAVTLPDISTVSGSNIDTDDFTVALKNIGVGVVTVTCAGVDTFDDGETSKSLTQYEFIKIQTDSDLAKWNIFENNIDVSTKTGTETLTNKTLESPVLNAGVSGSAVDTDPELAADSDTLLVSQKAVKEYSDNHIAMPFVDSVQTITGNLVVISLSIPPEARQISLIFDRVETVDSSELLLQIGDSSTFETSGYRGTSARIGTTAASTGTATDGYILTDLGSSGLTYSGLVTLIKRDLAGMALGLSGTIQASNSVYISAGSKTLSSVITKIRIRTTNTGTSFNGGSIGISYVF